MCLVLAFFATAGLWIMLEAEFLALILVLVYVGAVLTLFLFVVMMLNLDRDLKREGFSKYLPFALLITLLMLGHYLWQLVLNNLVSMNNTSSRLK